MTGGDENGLTLTFYTIGDREYRFRSHREASSRAASLGGGTVVAHSHTYRKGDEVEVRFAGAWRPGKVVSLKRVRVVVHFKRNKRGQVSAKSFNAPDIRPRVGEGGWVQI